MATILVNKPSICACLVNIIKKNKDLFAEKHKGTSTSNLNMQNTLVTSTTDSYTVLNPPNTEHQYSRLTTPGFTSHVHSSDIYSYATVGGNFGNRGNHSSLQTLMTVFQLIYFWFGSIGRFYQ